jgi:hypothetical protein
MWREMSSMVAPSSFIKPSQSAPDATSSATVGPEGRTRSSMRTWGFPFGEMP